jgi:hypothetical protein
MHTGGCDHRIRAEVWTGFESAESDTVVLREAVSARSNETISNTWAETHQAARVRPAVSPPTIKTSHELLKNAAASVVTLVGMVDTTRG